MSVTDIATQLAFATVGVALGWLTGAWAHASWKRWHPQQIRFWGTWYTDPRLLLAGGLALAGAWLGALVTS